MLKDHQTANFELQITINHIFYRDSSLHLTKYKITGILYGSVSVKSLLNSS